MAARVLFGVSSKREGDLVRVEVDLKRGATLLETRVADLNDKLTINEGDSGANVFLNDIAVEGYQKSDMRLYRQTDLKYGTLVRNIPTDCDTLVARVIDIGDNVAADKEIAVPEQLAADEFVDFEDGNLPPARWRGGRERFGHRHDGGDLRFRRAYGLARDGQHRRFEVGDDAARGYRIRAAARSLRVDGGRLVQAEGARSRGAAVGLPARVPQRRQAVRGRAHSPQRRLAPSRDRLEEPDGRLASSDSAVVIRRGIWRKWRLHLLRIATREATAVLYLDHGGEMKGAGADHVGLDGQGTAGATRGHRAGLSRRGRDGPQQRAEGH